jgi:hypothetical protein
VRLIVIEAISSRLEQFQGWGEDWQFSKTEASPTKASTQGLFSLAVVSKRPIIEMYQCGIGLK